MKKTTAALALTALKFAYNDCGSDFVRDEQITPAIAALEADIAQAVELASGSVPMKEIVRLRVLAETARHGTWSIEPHFGTPLYALKPDAVDMDEIGGDSWVAQRMTKDDADYLLAVQPSKLLDLLDRLNFTCTAQDAPYAAPQEPAAPTAWFAAPDVNAELLEALKYARRMVNTSKCDIAYIDTAIANAGGAA